jgi:Zn finger protein HypA/HybF involved in hydrogenase expression
MSLPDFKSMYRDMATSSPQMARGQVWCHACGATQKVDSADCLRRGWPKCCGSTMSIDSPDERRSR